MNSLKRAGIWTAWFAAAFLAFGPSIGSRNGSGTYTIPNTFVAGTPITAASHNQNMSDIATELTNSVAADGQTSMTGPLKASNGSVGAPSITFASDTDTGLYRASAGTTGVAADGVQVAAFSSAGIDAKSGKVLEGGFALIPAGVILDYAGATTPDGFLLCFGQAVSRTTYAALFTAIGTVHGVGDGSTTFNVPDGRGRLAAGKDDMGGSSAARLSVVISSTTLGATGGAKNQTVGQVNLPAVNFSVTATGTVTGSVITGGTAAGAGGLAIQGDSGTPTGSTPLSSGAASVTGTAASGGSGTALTTVQPTLIVNKIIKY